MIYVIRLIKRLSELRKTFKRGDFKPGIIAYDLFGGGSAGEWRKIFDYWSSQAC